MEGKRSGAEVNHQHRFWNMGDKFECMCGATKADDRTDEQRTRDRSAATGAFKDRYNKAWSAARAK